jgi:hypothetical protein
MMALKRFNCGLLTKADSPPRCEFKIEVHAALRTAFQGRKRAGRRPGRVSHFDRWRRGAKLCRQRRPLEGNYLAAGQGRRLPQGFR